MITKFYTFGELSDAMARVGKSAANMGNSFKEWFSFLKIYDLPNGRIKHLAYYSKKKRIRKKNYHRLLKGGEG